MRRSWKVAFVGLLASVALVSNATAQTCGDLNNDTNVNTIDALLLSQCLAGGGTCPAVSPGPLCSTGSLIDCGDVFGDGDVSVSGLTADLGTLALQLAGLATLFDGCDGPGPDVSGCPSATVPHDHPDHQPDLAGRMHGHSGRFVLRRRRSDVDHRAGGTRTR